MHVQRQLHNAMEKLYENVKIETYKIILSPFVLSGRETWSVTSKRLCNEGVRSCAEATGCLERAEEGTADCTAVRTVQVGGKREGIELT
jgi:hypothetical protein